MTLKYVGRIIVSHCFLLEAFNVFFFILLDSQLMYEVKGAVASPLLGLTMGTLLSWFNKTTSLTVLVSLFCISSIIYRQICSVILTVEIAGENTLQICYELKWNWHGKIWHELNESFQSNKSCGRSVCTTWLQNGEKFSLI